jgi:AcrR family transcriptional regulator
VTKRDAILSAADGLFAQHGYGLTGVDAIATKAGVTKRTLYKQFGSKEGLFTQWLRLRDVRTRVGLFGAVEKMSDQPVGRILAVFSVLATLAQRTDFHGCPFSRALLEFGTMEAAAAGRVVGQEHKLALAHWFAAQLEQAGQSDIEAKAEEIITLYEGVLMRMAGTRSVEPALAARRLLEARLR